MQREYGVFYGWAEVLISAALCLFKAELSKLACSRRTNALLYLPLQYSMVALAFILVCTR